MISRQHGLILVHIQKTGGTALSLAFGGERHPPEKHRTARELRALYGEEEWGRCHKVAFVRNPWDRLVSWWSMLDARRPLLAEGRPLSGFARWVLGRATTFEEFLLNCDRDFPDANGDKWIFRNQIDYLTDEAGEVMVDFVGRFERLQQDAAAVGLRVLGRPVRLGRINATPHADYRSYYTPALAELVARRYARDLERWGYRFDG